MSDPRETTTIYCIAPDYQTMGYGITAICCPRCRRMIAGAYGIEDNQMVCKECLENGSPKHAGHTQVKSCIATWGTADFRQGSVDVDEGL